MDRVPDWTVIIPLKPADIGKSRLGGGVGLTRAIALDTVAAAAAATRVARVIVVTADAETAGAAEAIPGVEVAREPQAAGIGAAIVLGVALAGETSSQTRAGETSAAETWLAALLGDLPALLPAELDDALAAAEQYDRAFVPDAEGTGTTMVTARGVPFLQHFGTGSAAAHLAAGLAPLEISAGSGLRRDVDSPDQLAAAAAGALGPRTRAVLEG